MKEENEIEEEKESPFDEEDFERLLDEFIASSSEEEDDDRKGESTDGFPVQPVAAEWCLHDGDRTDFSVREVFNVSEGDCLSVRVYYVLSEKDFDAAREWNFTGRLLRPDGDLFRSFGREDVRCGGSDEWFEVSFDLSGVDCRERIGCWTIEISSSSGSGASLSKRVDIQQFPTDYGDNFEVVSFGIYKSDALLCAEGRPPVSYTGIQCGGGVMMLVFTCDTQYTGRPQLHWEFRIQIYDSTGVTVSDTVGHLMAVPGESDRSMILQEEIDSGTFPADEYSIRISYMGETVIVAPFLVGEADVEGEYDVYAIQTSPPVGTVRKPDANPSRGAMRQLEEMIGLSTLKRSISDHLNYVRLLTQRRKAGLKASIPPLHMVFTGNPGTGKTTVADFIGEIYHRIGLLEKGHVVRTERSKLVGRWIGETEQKTEAALTAAAGGVLFIDEAYTLFTNDTDGDKRDFGNRVIETLLSKLSDDGLNLIVILAGYPDEMNRMLESNPGLKSRFPFTFHFEDYSPDELMQIAELTVCREGYELTPEAADALRALLQHQYRQRDRYFGNARYVTRLITSQILPAMGTRLVKCGALDGPEVDHRALRVIERADIPLRMEEERVISGRGFDDVRIDACLARLDAMVGLVRAKRAIHNLVRVARLLRDRGEHFFGEMPLKWSFTGNTGTGKSTVAALLAEILAAMNVLGKGQFVEVKGEQLYRVPDYKVDEVLQEAMRRSQQGMLFIDGDSPKFKHSGNTFDSEQLRIKLAGYTSSLPGSYALIIAENRAPRQELVEHLTDSGVAEVDHTIVFDDYTSVELLAILTGMLQEQGFSTSDEATAVLERYIVRLCENRDLGYANARTMKIISRTIILRTYLRMSEQPKEQQAKRVTAEDVACFRDSVIRPVRNRVGYCASREK